MTVLGIRMRFRNTFIFSQQRLHGAAVVLFACCGALFADTYPRQPGIDPLNVPLLTGSAKLSEASCLDTVWPTLDTAEKAAVLSDEPALRQLVALHGADPITAPIPARRAG